MFRLLLRSNSGTDPGFGQGAGQLLRQKVADIAEQSREQSELSAAGVPGSFLVFNA